MAEFRAGLPGSERPAYNISRHLVLGFLVAAIPTVFLAILVRSEALNLQWKSPVFQAFLLLSSALLSGLIGYWLHREVRVSFHPGVLALGVGFACLSPLFIAGAWLREAVYLAWFGILSSAWTALFALAGIVLISWRRARAACQKVVIRSPGTFWTAGVGVFVVFTVAGVLCVRAELTDQASLSKMSPWLGSLFLAVTAIALLFAFQLYLRRRTSVVLSFTLALYLFGLAVASRTLGVTWHMLWWFGHILNFNSLFLVAYGVVEGHRVREREILIAQLAALSKKLEEQSVQDALTGCYNRRYVMEVLEAEFRKSHRARQPLTLLVADVDNFKSINDTHGHPCGDFVLRELAARLREAIRTSDALARAGGEEFWIVLPLTNRLGGQEVAAKLLSVTRSRPFESPAASIPVTLSIGIADNLSPAVTDVTTLIQEADQALYSAKRAGKDRAVTLNPLSFTVPQTS